MTNSLKASNVNNVYYRNNITNQFDDFTYDIWDILIITFLRVVNVI